MKYFMFTHNDLDGVASPIIATKYFGNSLEYKILGNHEIDVIKKIINSILQQKTVPELTIFICDLSTDDTSLYDSIQELNDFGVKCMVFDHHQPSMAYTNKEWMYFNDKKCGSLIFVEWMATTFKNEKMLNILKEYKTFIKYTNKYDIWTWYLEPFEIAKEIRWLNRLVRHYTLEEFVERFLSQPSVTPFTDAELYYLKQYERLYKKFLNDALSFDLPVYTDKLGKQYILFQSNVFVYDALPYIHNRYDHINYIMIINKEANVISYRSTDGKTAIEIAQLFGGSGHGNAAGCQINEKWIEFYR